MNIAIIGANGVSGSLILKEAVDRGHDVTAIVRDASKISAANVAVIEKDLFDLTGADLRPFDVVVSAFKAPIGQETLYLDSSVALAAALQDAPDTKLIVVGGAGSLFVDADSTSLLMDTPDFPDFVYPTAFNAGKQLEHLRQTDSLTWTYISPAAFFDPEGPRTGSYRKGKDHVIPNAQGDSYVSYADFAIAVLDEIEHPQHVNERFTVVSDKK
ncbi:NAD(P)-dependent oxidoreductase [Paenibacillus sp. FSL W8-1187]|uniref:NAD(P)-dependent oxidoreductase n=1 Tax=Paenibacillus sp. FSL W8-1187 TaxID=2975339 RepID=UPI0030D75D91